jgi:hypothetical protein
MAYFNAPNFSKVVLRPLHATPKTVVLYDTPTPYHSHHRFPSAADVRVGIIYGPGQFEQQTYSTGTLSPGGGGGGGTRIYPLIG